MPKILRSAVLVLAAVALTADALFSHDGHDGHEGHEGHEEHVKGSKVVKKTEKLRGSVEVDGEAVASGKSKGVFGAKISAGIGGKVSSESSRGEDGDRDGLEGGLEGGLTSGFNTGIVGDVGLGGSVGGGLGAGVGGTLGGLGGKLKIGAFGKGDASSGGSAKVTGTNQGNCTCDDKLKEFLHKFQVVLRAYGSKELGPEVGRMINRLIEFTLHYLALEKPHEITKLNGFLQNSAKATGGAIVQAASTSVTASKANQKT